MLIRCLFSGLLRGADVYPAAGRSTLLPSLWGGRFFRPGVEPAQLSNAGPLVLVQGVAVFVRRDRRVGVAQQPGKRHQVHPLLQRPGSEGVPLQYIYDNTEKSSNFNSSTVFSPLF